MLMVFFFGALHSVFVHAIPAHRCFAENLRPAFAVFGPSNFGNFFVNNRGDAVALFFADKRNDGFF